MLLLWFLIFSLISIGSMLPLESGVPGKPWTEDEIDIVRDKVCCIMRLHCVTNLIGIKHYLMTGYSYDELPNRSCN